jgi:hypothetical protein
MHQQGERSSIFAALVLHAPAHALLPAVVEHDDRDLGAADVDP